MTFTEYCPSSYFSRAEAYYEVEQSFYLCDRAAVRSGVEIGLLSLRLSVSQSASLGDFLLAPVCPIEKVTLWEDFLYLTLGSETDEGVAKDKVLPEMGINLRTPCPKPSTLSTRQSVHPSGAMTLTN